jgi:adenosine deaminase
MEQHNLKKLLNLGLCVTVNSDDPAYFGGYLAENYQAAADALKLSQSEIYQLAKNSFRAAFVSDEAKDALIAELDSFVGH